MVTRKHNLLDTSTGRRFVIRDGMMSSEIAKGMAAAFGTGKAAARRKAIRQRIEDRQSGKSPSVPELLAIAGTYPPRYSKESIHQYVWDAYPEVRDHLSFNASQNVAIQLGGARAAATLGDVSPDAMPDDSEDRARLIRDVWRAAAEAKQNELAKKEATSRKQATHGRKARSIPKTRSIDGLPVRGARAATGRKP